MINRRLADSRAGMSLLEVIIALAIFLLSLVAISQLIEQGANLAVEMDERSYASMLAQSKLAEVVAGSEALTGIGDTPIDGEDNWFWRMDANADAIPNLFKVVITVTKETRRGKIEVAYSQYVLDPTKRGSTDATAIGTDDTSTNGTTSTTPTSP